MNFFKGSSCGKYIQATEKLCPKCGNINYAKKENVYGVNYYESNWHSWQSPKWGQH